MANANGLAEGRDQLAISAAEQQFFLDNGYLILRGVLDAGELAALRSSMDRLMGSATETPNADPDFIYGTGHKTGRPVLKRIEYVIAKSAPCKALLGHPYILRSVEKIVGRDLIPTWDSMVLKMPGEGIVVPWHQDAGREHVGAVPIFNVDFYLDAADQETCLWVYPGSHRWVQENVDRVVKRPGFSTEGAVAVPMKPGDVLFHDILLLHGSPANVGGKLRRVIYYEFRTAGVEMEKGPHTAEYIGLKQAVLRAALRRRRQAEYVAPEEAAYEYAPPAPFDGAGATDEPGTWRVPHEAYWRAGKADWIGKA